MARVVKRAGAGQEPPHSGPTLRSGVRGPRDEKEPVPRPSLRAAREAERAELIVESEVMQFQQALRNLDIGPTVGALKEKLRGIAREEFQRQRGRLGELTPEQEQAIEAMLMSAVNKISHPVIHRMRRSYDSGEDTEVQAWRESFGLGEE